MTNRTTRARSVVFGFFLFAFVALSVLILYGASLASSIVLIDDHEYFLLLGPTQSLPIAEIIQRLSQLTELGSWGESMRFRPAYFLGRAFESSVFGLDPLPRYVFRVATLIALSLSLGMLMWNELGKRKYQPLSFAFIGVSATAISLLLILQSSWLGIIPRLGPSEILVALGLVPYLLGAYLVWNHQHPKFSWILLGVGYNLIILSKENTFSLLVPVLFLAVRQVFSSKHRWLPTVVSFISIATTIWVVLGITLAMQQNNGTDVYGVGRTFSGFIQKLLEQPFFVFVLAIFLISFFIEFARYQKESSTGFGLINAFPLVLTNTALLLVIIVDVFVYQSSNELRYLLLSQISSLISLMTLIVGVLSLRNVSLGLRYLLTISMILVFLVVMFISNRSVMNPLSIMSQVQSSVFSTNQIHSEITQLSEEIARNPDAPVVLYMEGPLLEPAFAISRITWFESGKLLYLGQPYPELQTGNSELLFEPETFDPKKSSPPICVLLGTYTSPLPDCRAQVQFSW